MNRSALLPVVALLCLCACDRPTPDVQRSPGTASVDTLGGVIHVRNWGAGAWRPEEVWTVEEVWRIGAIDDEGPGMLVRPTGLAFGPHNQILVVEFGSDHVLVFDGSGAYVRTIGRAGHGPGDLSGPNSLMVGPDDHLWVADHGNRRYTVFDSLGALVRTVPRPVSMWNARQKLVLAGGDTFLDETGYTFEDGRRGLALVRVDTTGAPIETYPMRRFLEFALHAQMVRLPPPVFGGPELGYPIPRIRHVVGPDGTIWIGRSDEMRFVQRTLAGDTLRIIESDHRSGVLTPDELDEVRRALAPHGVDISGVTLTREIVRGLYVLHDGHLLVQVAEEVPDEGSRELDVFRPEGIFLGTIRLSFGVVVSHGPPDAALVGDTLVASTTGKLDVPILVRAVIRRGQPSRH